MNFELVRKFFFVVVMGVYLWYPFYLITGYEEVLETGVVYRFRPMPVDPYDAFRGRYVRLSYSGMEINYPDADSLLYPGEKVFVGIQTDTAGFAVFSKLFFERPDFDDYIETAVQSAYGDQVFIKIPESMGRYYLNEKLAPLAETAYRELALERDPQAVYLDVRVYRGEAVIETFYMKGMEITDYLLEHIETREE